MTAVVRPRANLSCLGMMRSVPRHCAAAGAAVAMFAGAASAEATQPVRAMMRRRLFIFDVPVCSFNPPRRSGRRQPFAAVAVAVRHLAAEVLGELLDGRLDGPRRGVAERAETLALDVVEELRVVGAPLARLDALEDLDQPVGALAAGRAPAARLVLVELGQV